MFFLSSKCAFHRCRSHSGKFPLGCILHLVLAFLGEGGLDFVLLAEVPDHKTSACDPYSNFPGNSFTKSLNAVRTSTYEGFELDISKEA